MTFKTNAQGKERKRLALVIAKWTGNQVKYAGAPTFNYEIGGIVIDRNAEVDVCNTMPDEVLDRLLQHLYDEGFDPDMRTAEPEEQTGICISMPRSLFTETAIANLHGIIASKKHLICKALGVTELPVEVTEDRVSFPWFPGTPSPEEIKAYDQLICRLCDMARNQKRVVGKEKPTDNEKYAFRCVLLRLGFIGDEMKAARKILLRNFSGSSAFKAGTAKGVQVCE